MTSLCQIDSNRIILGDSAGYMHTLDLRRISNKHGRSISANVGRFNGPAGSVRKIVKHESLPIVACVGLDRMLRTYDVNTRKQLDCVYLKQRLNCMLFCTDRTWDINDEEDEQEYGTVEDSGNPLQVIAGNIDDEDEVEDYVDSSDEEDESDDDENDGNESSSSHMIEDDSESEDDESSTASEEVENDKRQKKRRRR